ncbi:hypothetical protein V4D30_03865 [Thermodesulfovibrio sp. 3907-1M]|uniref:Transposase n=1 Tax=Thermodesulfovibrio autotrophicus TaxID=3118333 RepID=A0AAU8GXZ4_9BACT
MENHKELYEAAKEEIFRQAVEKVFGDTLMGKHPGIKRLLEETINQIMKSERQIFLKNNPGNKANGYYPRQLSEGSFCLDLKSKQESLTSGALCLSFRACP